jgi:restriction system protein
MGQDLHEKGWTPGESAPGIFPHHGTGRKVLQGRPERITNEFLEQFEEFREFRLLRRSRDDKQGKEDELPPSTPEEVLESAYKRLRDILANDLLELVRSMPPSFFERLVVELLVKMGYGGNREDAASAIGRSGDEGIDGIIKEDQLGLDIIYIQAKRWNATVGRPEVQKFAGALQGHRARKGIMITTSDFSREAWEYVTRIDSKVVLIDGQRLAQLMSDHNLGVSTTATYELKKVDSDYFDGE